MWKYWMNCWLSCIFQVRDVLHLRKSTNQQKSAIILLLDFPRYIFQPNNLVLHLLSFSMSTIGIFSPSRYSIASESFRPYTCRNILQFQVACLPSWLICCCLTSWMLRNDWRQEEGEFELLTMNSQICQVVLVRVCYAIYWRISGMLLSISYCNYFVLRILWFLVKIQYFSLNIISLFIIDLYFYQFMRELQSSFILFLFLHFGYIAWYLSNRSFLQLTSSFKDDWRPYRSLQQRSMNEDEWPEMAVIQGLQQLIVPAKEVIVLNPISSSITLENPKSMKTSSFFSGQNRMLSVLISRCIILKVWSVLSFIFRFQICSQQILEAQLLISIHCEEKNSMQSSQMKRSKPNCVHRAGAMPSRLAIFSREYYRMTYARTSIFFFFQSMLIHLATLLLV